MKEQWTSLTTPSTNAPARCADAPSSTNKDGLLSPGLFARLALYGGDVDALLIPDTAIVSDQAHKIVYTVNADNVVTATTVTLGPMYEGLRVITAGLKPTDRVVIEGVANPAVRPGAKVAPAPGIDQESRIRRPRSSESRRSTAESPMRLSHFFIDRPIFASVVSMIITILGVISLRFLPIAEYPEIAPPTVSIHATYPGASAQIIAETVATPIEQEVNGVDDMLYINSQSTGDGQVTINVVFKPGTNVDEAQVLVQNRVAVAEPRLPEDVRRLGISVRKASPDLMMVVHMVSPDGSRRSAVHFELHDALRQRRADAHRRRRRRDRVRRARLLDAYLARPGQGGGARLDRRRGRRSVAGFQSAGRRRFYQSAASNVGRRLHAQRQDARAPELAGAV